MGDEVSPHIVAKVDQAWAASRQVRTDAPQARAEGRCATPPTGCGQPLGKPLSVAFRDQRSRDEYDITGLCQGCQDELWKATPEEVAAMDADVERYGRCFCGEYRPYEFVDVGVGTIRGFDCCDPLPGHPQCEARSPENTRCLLQADHAHGHDFALPNEPHVGERDHRERTREKTRHEEAERIMARWREEGRPPW